ncbi:hypothetical protein EROM_080460 [Encephalitozoon romaleae SJ-2008]|uniref:Uncharacterized protein n=1 Tax=Encephalitozoon romaleae (strain SJ-2008) TaxID=1178016 RepID=I6ZJP5_ENCRO|nr:hypothetical protein EROM_080460 [Encephalitozoon romaleae SJ-2008]AFN83468.1 hypothetical protein EROM_080460 [Encephalitozoon romaleae SJ-2008]
MLKVNSESIKRTLNIHVASAVLAFIGGILKLSSTFTEKQQVKDISKLGLRGILVLSCLGFLWNSVDTMLRRVTAERFKRDNGFLNSSVIVSLLEIIMMLVCIKMMFFYPLVANGEGQDAAAPRGLPEESKFGLFGAIFLPYIFSECLRLLLSYRKNMKGDKIILAIIITGCLVMGGLGIVDYKNKGNYIGGGIFAIGLLMVLARLGFMHEEDVPVLGEEDSDEEFDSTTKYVIIGATFLLVLAILLCSHKILFKDCTLIDYLKSFNLFGNAETNGAQNNTLANATKMSESQGDLDAPPDGGISARSGTSPGSGAEGTSG